VNIPHASIFWEAEGERISPVWLLFLVDRSGSGFLKDAANLTWRDVNCEVFNNYAVS
jgi:hypothetical protein